MYHCMHDAARLHSTWALFPPLDEDAATKDDMLTADGLFQVGRKALVVIAGLNIVIEVSGEDQKAMAAELVAKKSASLLGALLSKLEHISGASAPKHAASSSSSIALGTT